MTTASAIELRTFTTLDPIRGDLLDVYDDVRIRFFIYRTTQPQPSGNVWTGTAPTLAS